MIFLELFLSFVKVGFLTIGGGYSAIPVIQSIAVDLKKWLTLEEFTDIITIAEMTPGPVAINSSTFVGIKVAGLLGAIVATLGFVFPSFIIALSLAFFYYKYKNLKYIKEVLKSVRPAIVAIIACAGLSILSLAVMVDSKSSDIIHNIDYISLILFILSLFVLIRFKNINPVFVMLGCGAIGLIINTVRFGITLFSPQNLHLYLWRIL